MAKIVHVQSCRYKLIIVFLYGIMNVFIEYKYRIRIICFQIEENNIQICQQLNVWFKNAEYSNVPLFNIIL